MSDHLGRAFVTHIPHSKSWALATSQGATRFVIGGAELEGPVCGPPAIGVCTQVAAVGEVASTGELRCVLVVSRFVLSTGCCRRRARLKERRAFEELKERRLPKPERLRF